MAQTSLVFLDPYFLRMIKNNCIYQDRFIHGKVVKKRALYGRLLKYKNSSRSLFKQVRDLWRSLSFEDKRKWVLKGKSIGMRGYNLFTQDTINRLKLELPGLSIPNDLYEVYVYKFEFNNNENYLKIAQLHPSSYFYYRKVRGSKSSLELVRVNEILQLPLTISLSYKSDLEPLSDDYIARFYAEVYHSWQGVNLTTTLEINFNLNTDWVKASNSLEAVRGYVFGYTLFFEFKNLKGKILIDHVEARHSMLNWARDWLCNDLFGVKFLRFWQIPPNWVILNITDGVNLNSVYYEEY